MNKQEPVRFCGGFKSSIYSPPHLFVIELVRRSPAKQVIFHYCCLKSSAAILVCEGEQEATKICFKSFFEYP